MDLISSVLSAMVVAHILHLLVYIEFQHKTTLIFVL